MMKNIKYHGISLLMAFALFSCDDYLDVNTDPDNPNNTTAAVEHRLPAIEHAMSLTYGVAAHFTSLIEQHTTVLPTASVRYRYPSMWIPKGSNASTYPAQIFFVIAGANFKDMYDKAEAESAYHYMATVKAFRAIGFMMMTDLYGEVIYKDALGDIPNGKFDDGKTVFEGAMAELDEAIELFQKTQPAGATPLSKGDTWNGGDVDKWLKMCYGFKARWLNNLSKKSNYDPDAVLAALEKAAKSNAESTIIRSEDIPGNPVYYDPSRVAVAYSWLSDWGTYYLTKWYTDLLTDDPRAGKLIPMMQQDHGVWTLSQGIDNRSSIRKDGGPVAAKYDPATKLWSGDSIHINLTEPSVGLPGLKEKESDGNWITSGTFYARPDAIQQLMSYPEICFIKAEVLFKKGDKGNAFAAYQAGIQAHFDLMNAKLAEYNVPDNPSKQVIPQADITDFINSAAVGTADDLTLGKIMQQKYIAMGFSHQNWNDLRRYDYDANIYRGWAPPYEYTNPVTSNPAFPKAGDLYRRFRQQDAEHSYNNANVGTSHPHALLDDIYSFPVWWDYPTDDYQK